MSYRPLDNLACCSRARHIYAITGPTQREVALAALSQFACSPAEPNRCSRGAKDLFPVAEGQLSQTPAAAMATFTTTKPSEEETNKVYDRQIRLWGADAQRRIQASRVLFLGLGPANVELCKNLVLAGFSATIADHRKVDAASLGYNFFADAESIGKSAGRASIENIAELNPFADVKVGNISSCTDAKTADALVEGHGVVIIDVPCVRGSEAERKLINEACRKSGAKFLAVRCSGDGAAAFLDLGAEHTYVVETGEGAKKRHQHLKKRPTVRIQTLFNVAWDSVKNKKMAQPPTPFLLDRLDALFADRPTSKKRSRDEDDFVAFARRELEARSLKLDDMILARHARVAGKCPAHIAAVVGGVLGQEVVKAVSGRGAPTNNVFAFDAATGAGTALFASPVKRAAAPKARRRRSTRLSSARL